MKTVVSEFDILQNDVFDLQNDVFELQCRLAPYFDTIEASFPINQKSILMFGNIGINSTKHFNRFQKIMCKLLLGIKIVDFRHDIDH